MGWLQNATASAKNGSVLLLFLISRLPQLPFSRVPANQSGTYSFDLRVRVHSILTSHQGPKPVLALGHLEYLHEEVYPRFADLPRSYRSVLLKARVDSLRDFGGEWPLPIVPGDAIDLNDWKVQNVVIDEIRKARFLAPQNHNRLLLFSDHGKRTLLNNDNFILPVFYEVPLITFGVLARDIRQPISLLDRRLRYFPETSGLMLMRPSESHSTPSTAFLNSSVDCKFTYSTSGGAAAGQDESSIPIKLGMKPYNPFSPNGPILRALLLRKITHDATVVHSDASPDDGRNQGSQDQLLSHRPIPAIIPAARLK